ncbi:sulfatase-like hydrolase/transferase [Myxococcota bacterium]|nr:sulfatase-like hydrolase/transferase [Myxococcota bacterium]
MRHVTAVSSLILAAAVAGGCSDPYGDPLVIVDGGDDDDATGDDDTTPAPDDDTTPVDDDTSPPVKGVNGVVLLVIDTLRGDRVGCGDRPGMMPTVEAMLAGGACFQRAKSNAPWTTPSTAAILGGVHGQTHGMIDQAEDSLDPAVDIAPDVYAPLGFLTAQASANHAAVQAGIVERFQYDYNNRFDGLEINDVLVDQYLVDHVMDFLDERVPSAETKFFLHVQMYAPHFPFCPQDPKTETQYEVEGETLDFCRLNDGTVIGDHVQAGNEELLEAALALYDQEVERTDEQFAALVQLFEDRGLMDTTLFAFTADHGEAFNEHGHWGHSAGLTFDQIDVPLGIWGPGVPAGVVVTQPVSTVDIVPTLLDYSEVQVPSDMEGASLRWLVEDPSGDHVTRAYSLLGTSTGGMHYGITTNRPDGTAWTLLQMPFVSALFHTEADPQEMQDLYGDAGHSAIQAELQLMLDEPVLNYGEWLDRYGQGP